MKSCKNCTKPIKWTAAAQWVHVDTYEMDCRPTTRAEPAPAPHDCIVQVGLGSKNCFICEKRVMT